MKKKYYFPSRLISSKLEGRGTWEILNIRTLRRFDLQDGLRFVCYSGDTFPNTISRIEYRKVLR